MNKRYLIITCQGFLVLALLMTAQPLITPPVQAATFMVTNTNDGGAGSLRQAIIDANSSAGPDDIAFNIPASDPGYSNTTKVWVIQPNTPLPNLSGGSTLIDGHTQTTNQSDTNTFGPEVQLDGSNLAPAEWLFSVESNANTIKGLVITRAGGVGIRIRAGSRDNTVVSNYIGIDPTGVSAQGNGIGIELYAAATINTISGNVISGNKLDGIKIYDTGTDANTVKNNIIGLDRSGLAPIPNGGNGVSISNGPTFNSIGGDTPERNIISGNSQSGVFIHGTGTDTNIVWGNYIGTDLSGASALGNANSGVVIIAGAKDNGVQNNVISGNLQHGVYLSGSGTENNRVRLNIIGADEQVTKLIPNGQHNVAVYDGATGNWIGTISPPWGNVIVGAGWSGVVLHKSNQNSVLYNAIGTNEAGTATNLGNTYYGVHVEGMQNTIGISNTIAYNTLDGIRVDGKTTPAQTNQITRNSIYANGGLGIELWSNGNTELKIIFNYLTF
jgi:parallel beta-helix repeat protein